MSKHLVQCPDGVRIDVRDAFQLVCWARYFRVSQAVVRAAVEAVGDNAAQVAAHLGMLSQHALPQATLGRWAV